MLRLRPWSALVGLILLPVLRADEKQAEKWLVDRALTISPACRSSNIDSTQG